MAAPVNRHQVREVDRGVDLGGGKRAVAEELLDRPQIHSRLEKVGGEGVPQRVRVEMVEVCSAADGGVELSSDRAVTDASSTLIDEEGIVLVGHTAAPPRTVREIRLDRLGRRSAEGHQPFFAALAANADHPLSELEVSEIEGDELTDAEPSGIEKFNRRPISAPRPAVGKAFQKLLDGVTIGDLGCALEVVRVGHGVCGARIDGAFGDQKPKICAEGGESACDRTWHQST
jgi:hypothetical protein